MRYGIVFESYEDALIWLEWEEIDRSSWDLPPCVNLIRECPNCARWHTGKRYCSLVCEIIGVILG